MPNPAIDFPWEKLNVTGTGTVHAGPCVLHSIIFNGMTVVGTCAIYDGIDATGTLIGTFTLSNLIHVSCQPMPFLYDCEMGTGIHMVFTNLVADFTVMFK